MENIEIITEEKIQEAMAKNAYTMIKLTNTKDKYLGEFIGEVLPLFCAKVLADLFPNKKEEV